MNNHKKPLTVTQSLLVFLITVFIYIPLDWFVLSYLWNNLIAVFFELPLITSLAQSAGLILFKNYFFRTKIKDNESEEGAFFPLILVITRLLIFLILGWIIVQFI